MKKDISSSLKKRQCHKVIRMGYAGNFKYNEQKQPDPKLIEMDFHDWFYDFRIIGFVLLMIPFIYYGLRILLAFATRFKDIFNIKYGMISASLLLALGIAYIRAHFNSTRSWDLLCSGVSLSNSRPRN